MDASFRSIELYLQDIRRYFHHFTDHTISHSIRILDRLGNLLPHKQLRALTDSDLYFLIGAALVHDIGMVVAEHEISIFLKDAELKDETERVLRVNNLVSARDSTFKGVERLVVAEYVRRRHGRRCAFAIDQQIAPCRALTGGDAALSKWLGRISEGHTLPFSAIADSNLYPALVIVDSDTTNIQFIAICLRIGDLLDISTERASPMLRALSEPLVALSVAHWDQYRDVEVRDLHPGKAIVIAGTSPSQEAERVLREWVGWLKEECEQAVLLLNLGYSHYRLRLGRIEYRVTPQNDSAGRPLYEFHQFRFNLDEEEVFKRLFGRRLYGRIDVVLRELVQNAIDATRIRIAMELSAAPDWDGMTDLARRSRISRALRERADELAVHLSLSESLDATTQLLQRWLSVKDCGVGMSRDVIDKFLLKVGRSRWREDPRVRSLQSNAIGEFGIGFLSTFMVSDRTIIETRSRLPTDEGLRATIYSWRGYLSTEPLDLADPGTTVALLLKPEVATTLNDLAAIADYWFPFLELPLVLHLPDGSTHLRPATCPEQGQTVGTRLVFPLPESETIAAIEITSKAQISARRPSLSQDGIAIADVAPPILDVPSQKILREREVLADLRGSDRVSLDLSRNLVEGGADRLWDWLVPRIWDGITVHGLRNVAGLNCYSKLLQVEFELSIGQACFVLGPRGKHCRLTIRSIELEPCVQFVDANNRAAAEALLCDTQTIVLPVVPRGVVFTSDNERDEDYSRIYSGDDGDAWLLDEMEDEEKADDDCSHDTSSEGIDADQISRNPAKRKGKRLSEHQRWGLRTDLEVLRSYTDALLRSHKYVIRGSNGYSALCSQEQSGSVPLSKLGFWRMSRDWFALRSPVDGKWFTVHAQGIPAFGTPAKRIRSLAEYVLALLFSRWPHVNEWSEGWDVTGGLMEFAETIASLMEDGERRRTNDLSDTNSDDDIDAANRRKFERLSLTQMEELARQEDADDDEEYRDQRITDFVTDVLPRIDADSIENCLTAWDVASWGTRKWL